jgi:hypothetical protein
LASRFFGGYIADDEWLAACEATFPITGTVPEPMVHMLPGIQDQLELLIHSSVKDAAGWAMKVLSCVDGTVNPRSRWVVRLDRLGIKNNARAIVLFASDASVHKDVKRKAKFKDKLKQINRQLSHPPVGSTAGHHNNFKKQFRAASAGVASNRGIAMTLQMFARHISNAS